MANNREYSMEELVPIVVKLAVKYTGGDHSSVPYETAQKLMNGILYCIDELGQQDNPVLAMRKMNAETAYECGKKLVVEKVQRLQQLYNRWIPSFQDYKMECLRDVVVKGIPAFLSHYDVRYFPQETLLTLDYPILRKSSELCGVDAVYAYMECIVLEQNFLSQYDPEYIVQILKAYDANYASLFENICEIVLANVIGHILLHKPLASMLFDEEEYRTIKNQLCGKSSEEIKQDVENMLLKMVYNYYKEDRELFQYLKGVAESIAVRIYHGVKNDCLDRIFLI